MASFSPAIAPKLVQLLREAVPTGTRIAVLWKPGTASRLNLDGLLAAALPPSIHLLPLGAQTASEIDSAFERMIK